MDELIGMDDENTENPRDEKNKIFLIIMSLILLFILLINIFPANILSIIMGKIDSAKLENDTIKIKDKKIIFSRNALSSILLNYDKNLRTETKMCLTGRIVNSTYFVEDMYVPVIYEKSFNKVVSEPCNNDTIITLHTHPFLRCLFSRQDIDSYRQYRKHNNRAILGLMCSKNRFNFYIISPAD